MSTEQLDLIVKGDLVLSDKVAKGASVGVKNPVRIPPKMMIGISSARDERLPDTSSSLKPARFSSLG